MSSSQTPTNNTGKRFESFGLSSAIPAPEAVGTVSLAGGQATVALGVQFAAAPAPAQLLAIAQIVFTATGVEGVVGVRFSIGGAPIGIPLPDGTVTAEPVSRDAFPNLAPSEATPNGPA